MEKTRQKDKFEFYLDEMLIKLKECQNKNKLKSCSICEEYLTCPLQDEYVKAVYNSMSKGDTGGFEF